MGKNTIIKTNKIPDAAFAMETALTECNLPTSPSPTSIVRIPNPDLPNGRRACSEELSSQEGARES